MARKSDLDDENLDNSREHVVFENENTPEEEAAEVLLSRVVAELGQSAEGGKVVVCKINAQKERIYIQSYPVEQFNDIGLEGLRAEFGGGSYDIRVYGPKGKLATWRVVKMLDLKPADNRGAVSSDILQAISAMMQQNQENMRQLLEQMRPPPVPPQPTRQEMLQEMLMMKQVFSNGENANANGNIMETFLKGVEVAKSLNVQPGETSGSDVFLQMVKEFAPLITREAERAPQRVSGPTSAQLQAQQRAISAGPVIPAASPVSTPAPMLQEESEMQIALRAQLHVLLNAARRNADPAPYAEMILDAFDDATLNEFLDDPAAFGNMIKLNPHIAEYQAWFDKLRELVKSGVEDPLTNLAPQEFNDGN